MLDFNQMLRTRVAYQSDSDAIPIARVEGITSAAIFMGGGVITGDVPLMNLDGWTWEENMVRPSRRPCAELPGRRWRRTRRWRRRRPRRRRAGGGAGHAGARQAADAGARVRRERQPARWTGTSSRWCRSFTKKQPFFVQAGNEDAIRDAIAWAERQGLNIVIRTSPAAAVATADLLKAKNVPVILSNILSMPQGEDTFHAANYQAAGLLVEGRRPVRVLERRLRQRAADSLPGGDVRGVGPQPGRGDQGADDQRREDLRRRQGRRHARGRQDRQSRGRHRAIRSRFGRAFSTW